MTSRKISRRELLSSCSGIGVGDGCDPRLDRRGARARHPIAKHCDCAAQIERALIGVLADCGDDLLRDLTIESVSPAPNASRVLVTFRPTVAVETAVVLERLGHARAKLRTEAVAAIHRRHAPDLLFRVLQPGR